MVFNATLRKISVIYRGSQFYRWRKPKYPKKATDLPQVTDKLDPIILYRVHLVMSVVLTHNLNGESH